jgi:hypothetical protein
MYFAPYFLNQNNNTMEIEKSAVESLKKVFCKGIIDKAQKKDLCKMIDLHYEFKISEGAGAAKAIDYTLFQLELQLNRIKNGNNKKSG